MSSDWAVYVDIVERPRRRPAKPSRSFRDVLREWALALGSVIIGLPTVILSIWTIVTSWIWMVRTGMSTGTYLAAGTGDLQQFLHTVAVTLMGFGGSIAALIIVFIGIKLLVTAGHSSGEDGSGLRGALEGLGHVVVALFFITGAFFLVGLITVIVQALSK